MLKAIDIPLSGSICPNVAYSRSHSQFGICCGKRSRYNNTCYDYLIKISKYVLNCSEHSVMSILLHELIHTCDTCKGHDWRWKQYAAKTNRKYGYHIQRCGLEDFTQGDIESFRTGKATRAVKYVIQCPFCGATWKRKVFSYFVQHPEKYRCKKCNKKLVRIQ